MARLLFFLCFFLLAAGPVAAEPAVPAADASAGDDGAPAGREARYPESPGCSDRGRRHRMPPPSIALEAWISRLPADLQGRARAVVAAHARSLDSLHEGMRLKMDELVALRYDGETPPESLPRLGHELQELRDALRAEIIIMDEELRREIGVSPGPPPGRGCRLEHVGR